MIAVLGALFVVGTALSFFLAAVTCGKMDLFASPSQGALWALFPAVTYNLTGSTYAMIVSTWVPTLILIFTNENTICSKKPETLNNGRV
jgi:hypothetical protein